MKWPNLHSRRDRTIRLMTASPCGTDTAANRLGDIPIPEANVAVPRGTPYIWATWLPRLLTGENSCEWAVWFKAHYQDWTRTPSELNQTEWMLNRTSLLNEHKTQWEARGQDVYVEGQNSFRLRGQSATLAGRPDLIVVRNDDALIIDIKAGQQQRSHYVQIMI